MSRCAQAASARLGTARDRLVYRANWRTGSVSGFAASSLRSARAKRGLPGLLHRELLSPGAHQRGGARVACVTLERVALEKGPSATDADRLLGHRDDRALHADMRRPRALHRLRRRIDLRLGDGPVVERAGSFEREEHLCDCGPFRRDLGVRRRRARHPAGQVSEGIVIGRLHQSEKGRGEAQEEVGKGIVHRPEEAGRQHLRVVGNEHVVEHHVAADCGAHPHRVPIAGEGHARRVLGNLQIERALDPGLVAEPNSGRGVIRGVTSVRDKELPPVDDVAALDLSRRGAEAPAADGERRVGLALLDGLAVRLSVKGAILDDLAVLGGAERLVTIALARRHRHIVGDRAHHQHRETVHVEGKRRRGIALRQLLRHQTVGFVVGPEPAIAFGHAEAKEPLGAEIGIVLERKGRVAVVAIGALGEALARQMAGTGDQFALPGGRLEVHQRLTADHSRASKPPRKTQLQAGPIDHAVYIAWSRQRSAIATRRRLAGRPHLGHGSGPRPAFDFCDGRVLNWRRISMEGRDMPQDAQGIFTAGPLSFVIKHELWDENIQDHADQGVAICVTADVTGRRTILLRFNCFDIEKSYIYGPENTELAVAGPEMLGGAALTNLYRMDPIACGNPIGWTIRTLDAKLPKMLERAGYPGVAADLDEGKLREVLPAMKKQALAMWEEGERLTGHPGLPLEATPNLAAAE